MSAITDDELTYTERIVSWGVDSSRSRARSVEPRELSAIAQAG